MRKSLEKLNIPEEITEIYGLAKNYMKDTFTIIASNFVREQLNTTTTRLLADAFEGIPKDKRRDLLF